MLTSNRELLEALNETVEFLESPKVLDTELGNTAYLKAYLLKKQISALEAEVAEEDAYIDMMAERLGY